MDKNSEASVEKCYCTAIELSSKICPHKIVHCVGTQKNLIETEVHNTLNN